jgi:hypothetical protein
MGRIVSVCAVLVAACIASPAVAGQAGSAADICYGCNDSTIYGLTTLIAYLEANPDVDDGYKGPIITAAHAKILRLRAELMPIRPTSPTPCCYRRKPIYIR